MNPSPKTARAQRIKMGVRLDPDVVRFARLHRHETGEYVGDLINRLLRRELANGKREPAA